MSDTDGDHDRVWQAGARERARLASALHDGALQHLMVARQDLDDALNGDRDALTALQAGLEAMTIELRELTGALHEPTLDELPLGAAIERIARPLRRHGRLTITVAVDGPAEEHRDLCLRDAVRELLANVACHAGASAASVHVYVAAGDLHLRVSDDGHGFDPEAAEVARADGHLGLQRLRALAARLGGSFWIAPAAPTGSIATLRLPTAALRRPGDHPAAAPALLVRSHGTDSALRVAAGLGARDAPGGGNLAAGRVDRRATG